MRYTAETANNRISPTFIDTYPHKSVDDLDDDSIRSTGSRPTNALFEHLAIRGCLSLTAVV
jgi:hypothetical protein